ncbi:hypothetical protein ACET3X_001866 [Alternaria dauci]|uniref:DUF6604 domain-containing protein n=1 Tax=Alternaria dauci TaxID=48095 RepID=A0ABR3V026_9PLEO
MVPVALCRHFSRAIQTRRKVSQWYKARVNRDEKGDLRHEYFIKVLEDTFASLKPFLGTGGPEPAQNNASATTSSGLASHNRFAELTVDELAALADEEDIAGDTLPKVSSVVLGEAEEDKEDDFWIAVALMLQEQQDMREVVRENWQKYKSGEVDLAVAAMNTDTAIKLAQNGEAKFDLLVPRPQKYPVSEYPVWTLPAVLFYNNLEDMHQWPLAEIAKPSTRLGVTADAQSEAHFDFWPVFAGLKFYLHKHITKKNSIPQVVAKDFGDANIHSRTLRAIELAQVIETYNKISPWANYDGLAEEWKKLEKDPKITGHPIFRMLKKQEFYLYKHSPLLCGMLKYHYLLYWHAAGISHEATSCSILFMAHVYMGTQLRGPSDPVWPDMEFMLFSQDPRYVLLRRPPQSPEEARTLFDIATGQPTAKQVGAYSLDRSNFNDDFLGRPNGKDGLTSVAILQHFAFWLQADMPDLYFNGPLMQRQYSDTWKAIYKALERDPAWGNSFTEFEQSAQRAANAIISTSVLEGNYPRFMDTARKAMLDHLRQQNDGLSCQESEVCLTDMLKYYKRAARLLTDDVPLSIDNLYKGWTAAQRQKKKKEVAAAIAQTEDTTGNADLQEMFMAQGLRSMTKGAGQACNPS